MDCGVGPLSDQFEMRRVKWRLITLINNKIGNIFPARVMQIRITKSTWAVSQPSDTLYDINLSKKIYGPMNWQPSSGNLWNNDNTKQRIIGTVQTSNPKTYYWPHYAGDEMLE